MIDNKTVDETLEEIKEELDYEKALHDSIKENLKEYNEAVKSSSATIDKGIGQIDEVLKNTIKSYNTLIGSERHKYSMVTVETSKSISSLVKEITSLANSKTNIIRTKLENNIKTNSILTELKRTSDNNNKDKKTGTEKEFKPIDFLVGMNKIFGNQDNNK